MVPAANTFCICAACYVSSRGTKIVLQALHGGWVDFLWALVHARHLD